MEDILASIKRVIAEEKEIRAAAPPPSPTTSRCRGRRARARRVRRADEPLAPPVDLGPPLLDEEVADTSRQRLEELASRRRQPRRRRAAVNPLEEWCARCSARSSSNGSTTICREIVDEHVKREIHRITGRPV